MKSQQGIGLAAAIFVITLMGVMALGINLIVTRNSESFVEEASLTRAFYAAESGAGFAMNAIYPPEEYPTYGGSNCASSETYTFTVDGLVNCIAVVECSNKTYSGVNYMTIESTGTCNDVSRTIQVRTSF